MRGTLRQLAHDALVNAATLAGNNVFLPRDWPTNSATMPNIAIQTPREQKTPRSGRVGAPFFTTTTWLELRCQVSATDPTTVETDLETLIDQVEAAVMGLIILPPQRFSQIVQGEYLMNMSSDAAMHFGEATLQFGFEYPERFEAVLTDTFGGLNIIAADGAVAALQTSGATANGSAVLNFASVPAAIQPGQVVFDATTPDAVQLGSEVQSVTGTTVTLTKTAIGSGVLAGDTINFAGRLLVQQTINLPTS